MNNKNEPSNRRVSSISNGMKKFFIVIVLVLISAPVYAQEALPGDDPGINSATGSSAPTPGTTAAQQAQQTTPQTQTTSGFVALAPIPGLTQGVTANTAGLANFFNNLYKYLIGMAAVLAIIMIIWGGLEYSTQDSISKKSDGKERIYMAIFGLVLVLSPVLVFSIINPSILNLSINLPKLDTRTVAPAAATSCPSGTIGTPPNCLPPCVGGRRTNCNRPTVNAVSEGIYSTPQPGGWCYQIAPVTRNNETLNYICGNQTQCQTTYSQDYRDNQSGVLSSCRQY